jgi:hypothetical protein
MTMVAAGPGAVNWSERTSSFPFLGVRGVEGAAGREGRGAAESRGRRGAVCRLLARRACRSYPPQPHPHTTQLGVSSIALSWVFSPFLTGTLALGLFLALRALVLRSPHAYKRVYFVLPLFVFLTFFM